MKKLSLIAFLALFLLSCGSQEAVNDKDTHSLTLPLPPSMIKAQEAGDIEVHVAAVNDRGEERSAILEIADGRATGTIMLRKGRWTIEVQFYQIAAPSGNLLPIAYLPMGVRDVQGSGLELSYDINDILYEEPSSDGGASPSISAPLTPSIALPEGCQSRYDCDGDGATNFDEIRAGTNPEDASSVPSPITIQTLSDGDRVRDRVTIIALFTPANEAAVLYLKSPGGHGDENVEAAVYQTTWDTTVHDEDSPVDLQFYARNTSGNEYSRAIAVTVDNYPNITEFTGSHATIRDGAAVSLSWSTDNADAVEINEGVGAVEASGTRVVTPNASKTYTLTARRTHGGRVYISTKRYSVTLDNDGDRVPDESDDFPYDPTETVDSDGDHIGDNKDNCPNVHNDQKDFDGNGRGDACDDMDGDGVLDSVDNCPLMVNADQLDNDGDGIGNKCSYFLFDGNLSYSTTGVDPISVATGDLDGDGVLDLAAANVHSDNVSIFFGNGDGTFVKGDVDYSVSHNPDFVTLGDLNGDENLDLITANNNGADVAILLGNGDGSFDAAAYYNVGRGPQSVAMGDFNNDTFLDLAVAKNLPSPENNISILFGNGSDDVNDMFDAAVPYSTSGGGHSYSIATGDFDGDGDMDLVTTNIPNGNISILLWDGNGGFTEDTGPYPMGTDTVPHSVALGYFNADAILDLAVANYGSDNVSILLGSGGGAFTLDNNYNVGDGPRSVVVGDLDGDSKMDLVVANPNSNNVSILMGNSSNGTFDDAVNYGVADTPCSVAIGDLDGDGDMDVTVANEKSNTISTLMGNGDGTFSTAAYYDAADGLQAIAAGDWDGGGIDLVVASQTPFNTVSVLSGDGNGAFELQGSKSVGDNPDSIAMGYLNNTDTHMDLVVANCGSDDISIFLGNGTGTFGAPASPSAGDCPRFVAIDDLDGDGDADLVVANSGALHSVSIFFGNGIGTFDAKDDYNVGDGPISVAIGDLDGDGDKDLAVAKSIATNNVTILRGGWNDEVRKYEFENAATYSAGAFPISIAAGYFDADDNMDLAVANVISDNVSILLGNEDGSFAPAVNYPAGDGPYSIAVGDLNGDRKVDLAIANSNSDNVSILLGYGDGTFARAVNYVAGQNSRHIAIGDFDSDGDVDIAVANSSSDDVTILLNNTYQRSVSS